MRRSQRLYVPWAHPVERKSQQDDGLSLRRIFIVTGSQVPNLTQVSQNVDLVPSGTVRLPAKNLFDLKLSKVFRWGDTTLVRLCHFVGFPKESASDRN